MAGDARPPPPPPPPPPHTHTPPHAGAAPGGGDARDRPPRRAQLCAGGCRRRLVPRPAGSSVCGWRAASRVCGGGRRVGAEGAAGQPQRTGERSFCRVCFLSCLLCGVSALWELLDNPSERVSARSISSCSFSHAIAQGRGRHIGATCLRPTPSLPPPSNPSPPPPPPPPTGHRPLTRPAPGAGVRRPPRPPRLLPAGAGAGGTQVCIALPAPGAEGEGGLWVWGRGWRVGGLGGRRGCLARLTHTPPTP